MANHARLRETCERILRQNDRGRFTVPSPRLYPHQWAWDSAFAAIGWSHVQPERAWVELETLLHTQWDDGRIPHIYFHSPSPDYFPGPDFWQAGQSSSITQPPVWASALRIVYERKPSVARTCELLGPIAASHDFFLGHRDPESRGAIAVAHPWESGLDNAPVWDAPLSLVDTKSPPPFKRRDTAHVDPSMRPTDEQYKGYLCLVKAIKENEFGLGDFVVYDPLMTALLLKAEHDLQWLSREVGVDLGCEARIERLRAGLDTLWNHDNPGYDYIDARTEEVQDCQAIGRLLPLIVESNPVRREVLKRRALAMCPPQTGLLPSVSPEDPKFDARRYWRGPCWINISWLMNDALDDALREPALKVLETSGVYEYFDPLDGTPCGGEDFTWSAALALDWLSR